MSTVEDGDGDSWNGSSVEDGGCATWDVEDGDGDRLDVEDGGSDRLDVEDGMWLFDFAG